MRKFARAGIELQPSDFISAPSEMQFMVKEGVGWGLIRARVPLDPELTRRRIETLPLRVLFSFFRVLIEGAEQRYRLDYKEERRLWAPSSGHVR
jgi:hypothetical protein